MLWLDDLKTQDVRLAGGKASQLARLWDKYRIPPGFVVETRDAMGEVATAAKALGPFVAVRSSSAEEDGEKASFAGQNDTFLNVPTANAQELLAKIYTVGKGTVRAAYYAKAKSLSNDVKVLVQAMLDPYAAGVAFSCDPVSKEPNVVIESSRGLGDAVVSGTVTPEEVIVLPGGNFTKIVEKGGVLNDKQVFMVAYMTKCLQIELGCHVDAEWAIERARLYLLQVRPVTV